MLLASYRKRKALRSYRGTLGTKLRRTYGTRRHYAPAEVEEAARRCSVNYDYLCYALAMYCDELSFNAYHAERGETCDYERMRFEVGERLFDGDTSFNGATLTDPVHPHGTDSIDTGANIDVGDCGSGFDTGGFDGGCGGD